MVCSLCKGVVTLNNTCIPWPPQTLLRNLTHTIPRRHSLCLDRALKRGLSRLECGQFLLEIGNFLADCTQFGLGLYSHQVFGTKLLHYIEFKLASQDSEVGIAPYRSFPEFKF